MYLIHGTWILDEHPTEISSGTFHLWIETDVPSLPFSLYAGDIHPRHLMDDALEAFLREKLELHTAVEGEFMGNFSLQSFVLPTALRKPVFSPELAHALGKAMPLSFTLERWRVYCYRVSDIPTVFQIMQALADDRTEGCLMGADLLFWRRYMQILEGIPKRTHIPTFSSRSGKKPGNEGAFHLSWTREFLADAYEEAIRLNAASLPDICIARETDVKRLALFDREAFLRRFAEYYLATLLQETSFPTRSPQAVTRTLLYGSLYSSLPVIQPVSSEQLDESPIQRRWREALARAQITTNFRLCFRLDEAPPHAPDDWHLRFLAVGKIDPSFVLSLGYYWSLRSPQRRDISWPFGPAFEQNALLALGYAARIYPPLWRWLATDKPHDGHLSLEETFAFLQDYALQLRDAGYSVTLPACWTPEGRRRAKMRLKVSTRSKKTDFMSQGYLSLQNILTFSYTVALGDQSITEEEWEYLVQAKTPIVQFRGKWIELDHENREAILAFWQNHQGESHELALPDLLTSGTQSPGDSIWDLDLSVQEMLSNLQNKQAFVPIENPRTLHGALRDYQKRGVAWLLYLERLNLNACLADDMGLGKSLEVIACLLKEREESTEVPATLIIAPTSVLGNWSKEVERFAPHLRVLVHQGISRIKDPQRFRESCQAYDIVLTSFTLARQDEKLFQSKEWHRIVIDEAQNIKNPHTAQVRAILKLSAPHRLALTGTPVENRLRDLWSIFNFLNPGYLGTETQFHETFEIPIQKRTNPAKSALLKQMVEPFILRRVKTDKHIIDDLPEKTEQKMYCTLSQEQASLYEALVKNVREELKSVKGIKRKGLILSTLLKLKQICNHPAQFLQDGSPFTAERSHKFQRLKEMLEEVLASGESALIFTQFTEIGEALKRYLTQACHCRVFYLYGGTSVSQRDQMIRDFQDPTTEAAVFILSLRAGGVGVNLTRATAVFHFDRWWNPAVEDQATDRAFRIGQSKNVFVHKFISIGTLEERIDTMIEEKKHLSSMIIEAGESWLTELDNETFQDLIALRQSAVIG